MSITITVTDPTRDEALRLADYLYEFAGYGKTAGVVSHRFEPNAARQSEILKQHIEDLANTPDDGRIMSESDSAASVEKILAASPLTPVASVPTPAGATATGDGTGVALPECDSAGYPWDERIHSSSQALNQDGTWRLKRGVDLVLVTQVREDARAAQTTREILEEFAPERAATVPVLVNERDDLARVPVGTATVGGDGTIVIDATIPAATVPTPPAPVAAAAPTSTVTFPQLMQRVTAMCAAKTMTIERVLDAAKAEGADSIPLLATTHVHLVGAVAARLGITA